MTALEAARGYAERGWRTVPIPAREKGPKIKGWTGLHIQPREVERYFSGQQNVGLILGDPYNLTDVDLDATEALWAWSEFAPDTGFVFGRKSKPASHYFFYCDPGPKLRQYRDPCVSDNQKAMLVEVRAYTEQGVV